MFAKARGRGKQTAAASRFCNEAQPRLQETTRPLSAIVRPAAIPAEEVEMTNTSQHRRYAGYRELSEKINVPLGTVYGWVRRGFIPHLRLGPRLVRFDLDEVADWLQQRKVNPKA